MARYFRVSRAVKPVTVLPQFRPQSQNTVSRGRVRAPASSSGNEKKNPASPRTLLLCPRHCSAPLRSESASTILAACSVSPCRVWPRPRRLHPAVNPVARTGGTSSREGSRQAPFARLWLIRRLTDREKPVVKEPAVRYNGLPLLASSSSSAAAIARFYSRFDRHRSPHRYSLTRSTRSRHLHTYL